MMLAYQLLVLLYSCYYKVINIFWAKYKKTKPIHCFMPLIVLPQRQLMRNNKISKESSRMSCEEQFKLDGNEIITQFFVLIGFNISHNCNFD